MSIQLGELISILYKQFMDLYGDEDLACMATASLINVLLSIEETR